MLPLRRFAPSPSLAAREGDAPGAAGRRGRRRPLRVDHRAKFHMTGKPVDLMKQLCQAVPPGGVILDPFMGSGSTGVAALEMGYRFIGIEQDQHYFDIAATRLASVATEPQGRAA